MTRTPWDIPFVLFYFLLLYQETLLNTTQSPNEGILFITKQFLYCKLRCWNGTLITKYVRTTWPRKNTQELSRIHFFRTPQGKPASFPLNKARRWQYTLCHHIAGLQISFRGSGRTGPRAGRKDWQQPLGGRGAMSQEAGWVFTSTACTNLCSPL